MTTIDARAPESDRIRAAALQAFWLLRIGFTAAPILFGIDKFFNWTVHWPDYLAGWINNIVPGSGQDFTVNGNSGVVCGNIKTANATVYLIDRVLLPKS